MCSPSTLHPFVFELQTELGNPLLVLKFIFPVLSVSLSLKNILRLIIRYCFLPSHYFSLLSGFLFIFIFWFTWLFFLSSSQYYLRTYIICCDSCFPTLGLFSSAEYSSGLKVSRPSVCSSSLPYGISVNLNKLGFGVIWFICLVNWACSSGNFHSLWKITLTGYHEHIYIFVNRI